MTNEADRINAKLTDEARETLRTVISLDTFLALKGEARAARWRQLDRPSKWQLVAQAITRQVGDWTEAEVEKGVAHYDARYAASPTELAVEAALERLATENADHARVARTAGEKSDAAYFQRAATAYTNALIEYKRGVRPERLASGAWLLPSRRAGEAPHIIRHDGDWTCGCKAGASMHWPIALIIGIEVAMDDQERFDDETDDRPGPVVTFERRLAETAQILDTMRSAQQLGRRLAEARACYLEAA